MTRGLEYSSIKERQRNREGSGETLQWLSHTNRGPTRRLDRDSLSGSLVIGQGVFTLNYKRAKLC